MNDDGGFTLIELLISILILALVMGGLITAMLVALQTVDSTRQRVTDTTGAQLVSSYLVSDAQSADQVNPSGSCDSSTGNLLELRWTDAADNTTMTDVVYKSEPADAGNSELTRYVYSGTCLSTPSKTHLVANISTVSSDTHSLCVTPPSTTSTTCSADPLVANKTSSVGLRVTANTTSPKSGNYSPYTFEVFGSRRAA